MKWLLSWNKVGAHSFSAEIPLVNDSYLVSSISKRAGFDTFFFSINDSGNLKIDTLKINAANKNRASLEEAKEAAEEHFMEHFPLIALSRAGK